MSARLDMHGAYNRSVYSSAASNMSARSRDRMSARSRDRMNTQHQSARITGLENELKSMKEENAHLKQELLELRQTVKQIFNENSHEKFDERRINMIKFQVIQLERQISILTEALGSRSDAILEVENAMTVLSDTLRSYLASDVQGPMITISRKDLIALIENSESARIKLFKCIENVNKDELGKDLLFLNPFLAGKGKEDNSLSILDICLQRLDYLNLRHVAQTESKLCILYKELIHIHNQLEYLHGKGEHSLLLTAHIAPGQMERTRTSLLKTCVIIKDIVDDLLAISLLCPSAPWPVLKKPLTKDVPVNRVLEALPSLPTVKQMEVNHVITASIATCNHRLHLKEKEKTALKEEITFHQMVYDHQMQYTQMILDAIRSGYKEFEDTVRNLLLDPIKNIMEAYEQLKNSASEKALRNILLIFKENEAQLLSIVEMLEVDESVTESQGHKALSLLGEEFVRKVDELVKSHKKQLEPHLKDRKDVREEQKRLDAELKNLIEELEHKYEKQWVPKCKYSQANENITLESSRKSDTIFSNSEKSELGYEILTNDSPVEVEDLNPSGLRSFLDEDFKKSDNERKCQGKLKKQDHNKGKLAKIAGGRCHNEFDCNSHSTIDKDTRTSVKSVNKKGEKIPWKPEKEWVNDFSAPTSASDEADSSACLTKAHRGPYSFGFKQTDQLPEGVLTLPCLGKKKMKKKETSYEPDLGVAQRSLILKSSTKDYKG